jgi:hypothetical protein
MASLMMLPVVLIYPAVGRTLLMVIKASFYFSTAIFKFFVLKKREPVWEKSLSAQPL